MIAVAPRGSRVRASSAAALATALLLTGCASMAGEQTARAPQPAKAIETDRFYTGRWYEIARTPMKLTKGCVAGTTDYARNAEGVLIDQDACRMDAPQGKEKIFAGPVVILDPGRNTKVRVDYKVLSLFTVSRTYWMLDHGESYDWFIVSDPAFDNLSIFTRESRPSSELVTRLEAHVRELGYDPFKLEHPSQFPQGAPQ